MNGEVFQMPEDLRDLKEIDYDDPGVQAWLADQEARSVRLYGKLTSEEADHMLSRRAELQAQYPQKSVVELNQMELAKLRAKMRA